MCLDRPAPEITLHTIVTPEPQLLSTVNYEGSIPDLIREKAVLYNVNPDHALAIAKCESEFVPTAKNPTSTASGVFQFLESSWQYYGARYWGSLEGKDVFNAEDNIELAMYVMSVNGYIDWQPSQSCHGL